MTAALEVRDLRVSYDNGEAVLDGLSFCVEEGELLLIAGLSGCGKSTLCHALSGVIPQAIAAELSGSIKLFGQSIAAQSLAQLALSIALVFQDSDSQLFCTTVEDELAFGPENRGWPPSQIAAALEMMLERSRLSRQRLYDPSRLSGGEKKRLALAAVTMCQPRIVIFDEPLSGLDAAGRQLVGELLSELKRDGVTVLVVEHDLQAVTARLAERWLILDQGRIAACGPPPQLRQLPLLAQLELL